jgi:acetyltransferase-like isoleucine patch superfamily enzyme
MIAAHCYIIDNDHGMEANINMMEQKDRVKKVIIGNDVWLGAGAKILKGSVIEEGAVVGANAVVKQTVQENCIVAGVPAKVIGQRG